jgi:RHS repeat-associated protein
MNSLFVYDGSGKMVAEYSTQQSANPTVSYLTTDHLGTPRVITDKNGNVISRRDMMPFGEDLYAGVGSRTGDTGQKYSSSQDDIRQKFTGYPKDKETNLDFAEARYYNNLHGRFTAVDPLLASGKNMNPQTFNRYAYVGNNPLIRIDPNGLVWIEETVFRNGKTYYRPKWVDTKGEKDTLWEKYLYKSADSGLWWALNPDNGDRYGTARYEDAKWTYGRFTNFGGGYDSLFEGNLSLVGGVNTVLPIKDLAYMVSYMKNGNVNGAIASFGTIALTEGSAGAIGNGLLKFLNKVAGSRVTNAFMKALTRESPELAARMTLCCFVAGTPIHTVDGLKPIEQIKVGDKVLSYDEKTKQLEYKTVASTFFGVKTNIVKLRIEGEKAIFTTTNEHPFYAKIKQKSGDLLSSDEGEEGEWKTAGFLKVGDKILTLEGKWSRILKIELEIKPTFVYNFEVEGNHNYFVGEYGVLSHNCEFLLKLSGGTRQIFRDALEIASTQSERFGKFNDALGALASALKKINPSNQLYPLGDIGGSQVFGYARGGQGLVELEGKIWVVQRTTAREGGGWNFDILGEFAKPKTN